MNLRRWAALVVFAAALARLCHVGILWPEETLPLAAAVQMLDGRTLYREIWFDKPPLTPALCLLWGARDGWPLRFAGALFVVAACWLARKLAAKLWSQTEGFLAALGMAFSLTFWIPAAVIPLASDLLMLVPHMAAIYWAAAGCTLAAGVAAGVAFQINPKGLFVLAACLVFAFPRWRRLAAGFLLPNLGVLAWLIHSDALGDYYRQVWRLGAVYARDTFLANPLGEGLLRTANWAGFHGFLVVGALWCWKSEHAAQRRRLILWTLLAASGVVLGWRFFPRYYFLLLPPLVAAGARGILRMGRLRWIVPALLLIPLIRFGPRYVTLAADLLAGRPHLWRDVALDQDSRAAARFLLKRARLGDTLLVWGYRPEIFVYTRLKPATRYLESQPLTGVFADRHLFQTKVSDHQLARAGRQELLRARPTWLVDGLTPINPALAMHSYPDLRPWIAGYQLVGSTRLARIYRIR